MKGRVVWVRGLRTVDNLTASGLQTKPLNGDYNAFYIVIASVTLLKTAVVISRK